MDQYGDQNEKTYHYPHRLGLVGFSVIQWPTYGDKTVECYKDYQPALTEISGMKIQKSCLIVCNIHSGLKYERR